MSFYSDCRLYLISPPVFDPEVFADTLAATLAAGDCAAFQLRLEATTPALWKAATQRLLPICHAEGVAFMLCGQPEQAVAWDCDGSHLDRADAAAVRTARNILGADRQLGVSCAQSRDRAMEAAEAGADYVVFGSLFPTAAATPAIDPELLQAWTTFSVIPAVAAGGITPETCLPLIQAGANFLAVSDGVWGYKDGPAAAVRAFNRVIQQATPLAE